MRKPPILEWGWAQAPERWLLRCNRFLMRLATLGVPASEPANGVVRIHGTVGECTQKKAVLLGRYGEHNPQALVRQCDTPAPPVTSPNRQQCGDAHHRKYVRKHITHRRRLRVRTLVGASQVANTCKGIESSCVTLPKDAYKTSLNFLSLGVKAEATLLAKSEEGG